MLSRLSVLPAESYQNSQSALKTLERALRSMARVQDEESIATILRQRSRRYVKAISRQRPEVLTFVDG